MATKLNGTDVMNAIRNSASDNYRALVPLATGTNIQEVGNPILNYQSVQNEFLTVLVNKIALTLVADKMYSNPLAFLKKGAMPLGLDVEDITVNPSEGQDYEPNNFQGILTPVNPDVKAAYYRRNRRTKYKVTIKNEQLTAAFTSWGNLEGLIAAIVNSLYNGNTIGEFTLVKNLLGDATINGKLQQVVTPLPSTEAQAKTFMQTLRSISFGMTFPSTQYNGYVLNGGTGPVTAWTPTDEQIIIVRSDVAASVDVNALAAAFNLSYANYVAQQVIVDNFDTATNMIAFIGDRRIFQIRENLRKMTEFYNGEVMAWTYWYHCWDTYALCPFNNGVALVTSEYTPQPVTPPDPGDDGQDDGT